MRANTQNFTLIVPWELSTKQKRGNQPSCFRHSKLVWNREMTLHGRAHTGDFFCSILVEWSLDEVSGKSSNQVDDSCFANRSLHRKSPSVSSTRMYILPLLSLQTTAKHTYSCMAFNCVDTFARLPNESWPKWTAWREIAVVCQHNLDASNTRGQNLQKWKRLTFLYSSFSF